MTEDAAAPQTSPDDTPEAATPATLPSPLRDPEFASTTATALEPGDLVPTGIAPESYLRVVANPFLGFAGLVGWLLGVIWVFGLLRRDLNLIGPLSPILVTLFLASLGLIPGLFHYHCLDCGRSGRMSRWRWHVCPISALRRISGRPRRWRGPTPPAQVVLWLWLLLMAGLALPRLGLDWRDLLR